MSERSIWSCAAKISFHQTMFLLSSGMLRSSRQAGRHHFQIEDWPKSISVKYMWQLPGPTANITSLSDKQKNLQKKNVGFSHGSVSTAIYCFNPFLFVISAEFIIWFFGLGIAVEKWYQICLINFKIVSLLKKSELILCSFLSGDVRKLVYGKKSNFWIKTDRFFFDGNR